MKTPADLPVVENSGQPLLVSAAKQTVEDLCWLTYPTTQWATTVGLPVIAHNRQTLLVFVSQNAMGNSLWLTCPSTQRTALGPYAPQGSTSLLPKLSVTSKVSARTPYAWVGSRVHIRSSEDVILLEFTSPVDREYMRRRRKFH